MQYEILKIYLKTILQQIYLLTRFQLLQLIHLECRILININMIKISLHSYYLIVLYNFFLLSQFLHLNSQYLQMLIHFSIHLCKIINHKEIIHLFGPLFNLQPLYLFELIILNLKYLKKYKFFIIFLTFMSFQFIYSYRFCQLLYIRVLL